MFFAMMLAIIAYLYPITAALAVVALVLIFTLVIETLKEDQ